MPTLIVTVNTGFSGATHTEEYNIFDSVWDELDENGRQALMRECEEESIFNCVSASTEVIE